MGMFVIRSRSRRFSEALAPGIILGRVGLSKAMTLFDTRALVAYAVSRAADLSAHSRNGYGFCPVQLRWRSIVSSFEPLRTIRKARSGSNQPEKSVCRAVAQSGAEKLARAKVVCSNHAGAPVKSMTHRNRLKARQGQTHHKLTSEKAVLGCDRCELHEMNIRRSRSPSISETFSS
jgi:hypothetical protein